MEEKTADEIAAIFSAAGDSVTVINTAKTSEETDDEYKEKIKRNVDHLEIIKDYRSLMKQHQFGVQKTLQLSTKLLLMVRKFILDQLNKRDKVR